jgi:predicted  nucleic acid-binding Zn-ribbon protein
MGVYDQIKSAFQDIIAPEIRNIHGEIGTLKVEIRRLDDKIGSVRNELSAKIDAFEGKLIAEIRRFDTRIDSLDRELKTAMDIRERLVALEAKARP